MTDHWKLRDTRRSYDITTQLLLNYVCFSQTRKEFRSDLVLVKWREKNRRQQSVDERKGTYALGGVALATSRAIVHAPVPLDKESAKPCRVRAVRPHRPRPVRVPSGSLAETGPFSFLVIIEIDSQVLLLSRGAPLALITRCHAGLRTRTTTRSAEPSQRGLAKKYNPTPQLWNGYFSVNSD